MEIYKKSDMLRRVEKDEHKERSPFKNNLKIVGVGLLLACIFSADQYVNSRIENMVKNAPIIRTEFTRPDIGFYGFYSAEDIEHNSATLYFYKERVRQLNDFNQGYTSDGMISVPDLDGDGSVGRRDTEKD